MSERPARQPMTNGEREILWQIEKLFARWLDTVSMGLHREANHRQRIEELTQSVKDGVFCLSPQRGSIQFLVLQIMSQYRRALRLNSATEELAQILAGAGGRRT